MIYMKQPVTPAILDTLRINLSMQTAKLAPEPVCDFCGTPGGAWQYAAERLSTGAKVPCWRWLACSDCSSLVDANAWDKIEDKLCKFVRGNGGTVPETYLRAAARYALDSFHQDAVHAFAMEGITRSSAYKILHG